MQKIFSIITLLIFLLTIQTPYLGAEIKNLPSWVDELQSNVAQVLHTTIECSPVNTRDYVAGKEHTAIRLQGQGSLKEISDPFELIQKMFLSKGWKQDWRYAADGHGSSSIAYRKGNHFCMVSIWTDSSCDDEDSEHVASVFWFYLDCRESNSAQP